MGNVNIYCKQTEWKVCLEGITVFIFPVFLKGLLNELAQHVKTECCTNNS